MPHIYLRGPDSTLLYKSLKATYWMGRCRLNRRRQVPLEIQPKLQMHTLQKVMQTQAAAICKAGRPARLWRHHRLCAYACVPTKATQKTGWVPTTTAQLKCKKMGANAPVQAKQRTLLKQHVCNGKVRVG